MATFLLICGQVSTKEIKKESVFFMTSFCL